MHRTSHEILASKNNYKKPFYMIIIIFMAFFKKIISLTLQGGEL